MVEGDSLSGPRWHPQQTERRGSVMVPVRPTCTCPLRAALTTIFGMDGVPLYRQLADHYRQAIRAGALAPGERMPSVRELTRRHRVSTRTSERWLVGMWACCGHDRT